MKAAERQRGESAAFALRYSIELPEGFVRADLPAGASEVRGPVRPAAQALFESSESGASIVIGARPAFASGTLQDWAQRIAAYFGMEIDGLLSGFVGGPSHNHPCVFVEGTQRRSDGTVRMRIALLEDDERLITVHASCGAGWWERLRAPIERAVASFELDDPRGPTVACHPGCMVPICDMPDVTTGEWPSGRDAVKESAPPKRIAEGEARERARALIAAGRDEEAETLMRAADPSIHGSIATARLFEEALRESIANKRDTVRAKELYRKALSWWQWSFPEPHTEYEAQERDRWCDECKVKMDAIIGGARWS